MKVAKFEFSFFGVNTYVVYDEATREAAIIDPGMFNEEEAQAMRGFVEREKLKVTQIINTHLHIDHVIGNERAVKDFGAPIFAHPDDAFLGERLQLQADMFQLPLKLSNVTADYPLTDGEKIKIGDGELEVIHVPGHSPGGVALYDAKEGFLISGDALFAGSIGRTDLPGGDMSQLLKGIKSRLFTLPPQTVVYPGHGPATTIGAEIRSNPFLK